MIATEPAKRASSGAEPAGLDGAVHSLRKAGFVVTYRANSPLKAEWEQDEEAELTAAARMAVAHFAGGEVGRPSGPSGDALAAESVRLKAAIRRSALNSDAAPPGLPPELLLVTGGTFNFLKPGESRLEVRAIAHGLSNICRFGGQCDEFYSVAQHSVNVSYAVPPEVAFEGLMHDCAEAVLLDVPKTLKCRLNDYMAVEEVVEGWMRERFGIPTKSLAVKQADLRALRTEKEDNTSARAEKWSLVEGVTRLDRPTRPWSPRWARYRFASRFHQLFTGRWSPAVNVHLLAAIYLPRAIRPAWPDLER